MQPVTEEMTDGESVDAIGRIESEVRALHRSHLQALTIEQTPTGLILHGRAATFFGKQMAQEEVRRRTGPILFNRIVVGS
jgi:hypothetical protein